MIRAAQRTALLVAFFLLTSAATAEVECAWVLWEQINAATWSLKDRFSDADSCKRELLSGIRKSASRYPGSEDSGGNTAVIAKGSGRLTLTFACLPDTVDPRGPKGAPR